jgi:hypothetical protein
MTREEKLQKIESLKLKAIQLKKEVDYYNCSSACSITPFFTGRVINCFEISIEWQLWWICNSVFHIIQ